MKTNGTKQTDDKTNIFQQWAYLIPEVGSLVDAAKWWICWQRIPEISKKRLPLLVMLVGSKWWKTFVCSLQIEWNQILTKSSYWQRSEKHRNSPKQLLTWQPIAALTAQSLGMVVASEINFDLSSNLWAASQIKSCYLVCTLYILYTLSCTYLLLFCMILYASATGPVAD